MVTMKLNDNERLVSIPYDSMDTLLNREHAMLSTLQSNINRNGNIQFIRDTYISTIQRGDKIRYTLNIILTPTEE